MTSSSSLLTCPVFLLLLLTCLARELEDYVQKRDHTVHLNVEWPRPGHVFLVGREELYSLITVFDDHKFQDQDHQLYMEVLDSNNTPLFRMSDNLHSSQTQLASKGETGRMLNLAINNLGLGQYWLDARLYFRGVPVQIHKAFFRIDEPYDMSKREGAIESERFHVVGLVRARNCRRSVKDFLRGLALFVHQIVVLDDSSEDQTLQMVGEVAQECNVAKVLEKGSEWIPDKWADMQRLLEEGRGIGGTHFVILHCDELFSTSTLSDEWWQALRNLGVGESLSFPWIHFWKSLRYVRADWMFQNEGRRSLRVVDVAFRDDGQCSFLSNAAVYGDFSKEAEIQGRILQHSDDTRRFEMSRIPYDLHGKQREIRDERFGVLHFGYVNWSDAMDKIVLQRMLLRISHPEIPPHVLNKILMDVFDEAGVHGVLAPSGILGSWGKFGVDVEQAFGINDENFAYAQVWSEPDDRLEVDKTPGAQVSYNQTARAYCLSLIEKYGAEMFEDILRWVHPAVFDQPEAEKITESYNLHNSLSPGAPPVTLFGVPVPPSSPRVTVLVATKRPGGMDAVLQSLSKQTSKDFELVIVDELWQREKHILSRAKELDVKVRAISTSKPKASPQAFGFQNAWNSGLASVRAPYLAILNDYAWVPDTFVESIIFFYEGTRDDLPPPSDRSLCLISWPITQYAVPEDFLDRSKLMNFSALSVFTDELTSPPSQRGWSISDKLGPRDSVMTRFKPHWFWDGQAMIITRGMIELVNGFDEMLDYGNDCHMQNIRDRSALVGGQVWLAPASLAVEEIDHHNWFERGESHEFLMFNRLTKDTNLARWSRLLDRIKKGWKRLRADNFGFSLSDYYERQLDEEEQNQEVCRWSSSSDNWRCYS